jgi:hypothetical protein
MNKNARGPSGLAGRVMPKKYEIDIVLDDNSESVPCYATYDRIQGHVEFKFNKDTAVEDVMVFLEGQSITYFDEIASPAPTAARTTGKHTFLSMSQPITADDLAEEGLAKAGISYTIPFMFVVPERLLSHICSHEVEADKVKRTHLELPPSLGDQSYTYEVHPFMEDYAPHAAKIKYSIGARVARSTPPNQALDWIEKRVYIRIVPARSDEPPMNVDSSSADYALRRCKSIKTGLFKFTSIGELTAETSQPRSLHLPHPRSISNEPVTTMTIVNLRFDPVNIGDQPPQLRSIVSKLKIYTFFSAAPCTHIVEPHMCDNLSTMQGMHPESLELSSRCLTTVSWTRQDPSSSSPLLIDTSLRLVSQSTSSAASAQESSHIYKKGSPFFTASVLLPITLPTISTSGRRNAFSPTFHSCLISRIYAVELDISYHNPGSNVGASHITLKFPIQISAEGGTLPGPETGSEEAIVSEIERQFHLGETQADELDLQRPVYEELPSPQTRQASLESSVPPEYRTYAGQLGSSGPRTQSVSISA